MSTARLLEYAQSVSRSAQKGTVAVGLMKEQEAFSVGAHDRWAARAKQRMQSVIAVNVALSTLQSGLGRAGLAGPEADEDGAVARAARVLKVEVPKPEACYHDWWIVPKISLLP